MSRSDSDSIPLYSTSDEPHHHHQKTNWKRIFCIIGIVVVIAVVIPVAVVLSRASSSSTNVWESNIRLPQTIVPTEYTIHLQPNITLFTFAGDVTINIQAKESTNVIILHAVELNISNVRLVQDTGASVGIQNFFLYDPYEFLVIQLDSNIQGNYNLSLEFAGLLTDSLAGLYRSSYKTASGETRWIATTQFEATDARRAFPCWDEPAFKANFTTSITTEQNLTALTNMPEILTTNLTNGLKRVDFQTSVKMSTYLVAFVISDFVYIENYTTGNTLVRVWARSDIIASGYVALDAAVKMIAYYEEYFGLDYPLPKQDLVAIPDFAAGAMENWGLITYRETALMYDANFGSAANMQRVVVVVAHELAHQWFGDIVTMAWWDGLWLNEGFASYVEYVGTDHVYPTWRMWSQFVSDTQMNALNLDSVESSHPVLEPVNNPAEINELFDDISYDKGASLIQMMASFLTEPVFINGLQKYLKAHAFGNTETSDLWNSMSIAVQEAGLPLNIAEIMDTWTLQMGYPVLTLTEHEDGVHVTQRRFLQDPNAPDSSYDGYVWDVPVTYHYQTGSTGVTQAWLWKNTSVLTIPYNPTTNGYLKVNSNQTNFFRVNYSPLNWQRLQAALLTGDPNLSEADRAGLIEDSFSLANAGYFPVVQALNLSLFLLNEDGDSYPVWAVALSKLEEITTLLRPHPDYGLWQKYMQDLLTTPLAAVGWNNTGVHTTKLSRSYLTSAGVEFDVTNAKQTALSLFQTFYNNPTNNTIIPDLRSTVYSTGVAELGAPAWNFMYDQYSTTLDASEKTKCLYSLAAAREGWLLQKALNYSLDSSKIRSQDASSIIQRVSWNPIGQQIAWDFVRDNWDVLFQRYGVSSFTIGSLVAGITENFQTQRKYDEVQSFFQNRDVGSGTRAVQQALESIQVNIQWINENYTPVIQWLASR